MALIQLTVASTNYSNLTTTRSQSFDSDQIVDLQDCTNAANAGYGLNGNAYFTYPNASGGYDAFTVSQTVAQVTALATASQSVTGTTSETFGIDTDAADYVLLKNNSGNLQILDDDGSTLVGVQAAFAAFTQGAAESWSIDAGTTDTTVDVMSINMDVNSASVAAIKFDIDVGTALSAAETVYGLEVDIDGDAGDDATSVMSAFYATSANTTGGVNSVLTVGGTWDAGIDLSGGTITADITLSNGGVIHNTSASIMTFTEAGFNFVGNVTFNGAGGLTFGTGGGAADVQTVTCSPVITAYVTGMAIAWVPTADNTGACTVNVDSVGAKSVKTQTGADPAAGDLDATGLAMAIYDGTNFVLINPATTCD